MDSVCSEIACSLLRQNATELDVRRAYAQVRRENGGPGLFVRAVRQRRWRAFLSRSSKLDPKAPAPRAIRGLVALIATRMEIKDGSD